MTHQLTQSPSENLRSSAWSALATNVRTIAAHNSLLTVAIELRNPAGSLVRRDELSGVRSGRERACAQGAQEKHVRPRVQPSHRQAPCHRRGRARQQRTRWRAEVQLSLPARVIRRLQRAGVVSTARDFVCAWVRVARPVRCETHGQSSRGGTSGERPYRAGDPTAPLHADRHARACTVGPYPDAGTLHAHSATQQPAGKPGAFTEQAHGAAETYTGAAGVRIIVVCATAAAAPWKPSSSSWLRARAYGGSRRQQQSHCGYPRGSLRANEPARAWAQTEAEAEADTEASAALRFGAAVAKRDSRSASPAQGPRAGVPAPCAWAGGWRGRGDAPDDALVQCDALAVHRLRRLAAGASSDAAQHALC